MYFFLLILGILVYAKCVRIDDRTGKSLILSLMPIAVVLIITFSLQYDVGRDYFSYIEAATRNGVGLRKMYQFITDREYLFSGIVFLSQCTGVPQTIFFFTALVQVIPFCIALCHLQKEGISVWNTLFLYFVLSLSFFNQFNGIRQFAASNVLFWAALLLFSNPRKILPWVLLLLTPLIHHASAIMVLFMVALVLLMHFYPNVTAQKKWLYIISLLCCLLYVVDVNAVITWVLKTTRIFTSFVGSSYLEKMSLSGVATKIIKLVAVFYAVHRLHTEKLTQFENRLLTMSYASILVMIMSFSSTLIWRMYLFFDIFLIFPVLLFFKYDATKKEKGLISLYLIAFLLAKILLLPSGEYLYSSILWN